MYDTAAGHCEPCELRHRKMACPVLLRAGTAPETTQAAKGELEDQMSAVRSQLDGMKDTETSLQVGRCEALTRMGHGRAEGVAKDTAGPGDSVRVIVDGISYCRQVLSTVARPQPGARHCHTVLPRHRYTRPSVLLSCGR